MKKEIFSIKNKIADLSYTYTQNGVELPVLDITHPLFVSSINEVNLSKMVIEAEKNAEKNAEKFNKIPRFVKKFLSKRSFVMAEMLANDSDGSYLSGLSTLIFKLGPNLIGAGKKRFLDRLASKAIGAVTLRMRVRDISICQANALKALLSKHKNQNLCMVNIAGGAASDSINSLFLILKEDPSLLDFRKIEINILDIDSFGPGFAKNCIDALKLPGNKFNGLNISIRHIQYDWNNTTILESLLAERKDWLQIFSSEGGLFEYCSDEIIQNNLRAIYKNSGSEVVFSGSLIHDVNNVDKAMIAALKVSPKIKPRFLGILGLKSLIDENEWVINQTFEGNPRYMVFSISKIG